MSGTNTPWETQLARRAEELLATVRSRGPLLPPPVLGAAQVAATIDHTLLKAEATPALVERHCSEAREFRFASVCVNPFYVAQCARTLHGSGVGICSVAGFPLGVALSEVKAFEAQCAIRDGASEIDMVVNVGALKARMLRRVREDIAAVVAACRANGAHLKVILETCLLTDEEKVLGCLLAVEAGADFVKTSTGLSTAGATVADVALMRIVVGPQVGVKAAGGIRDYHTALAMLGAGATRLGASASVQIIRGAPLP